MENVGSFPKNLGLKTNARRVVSSKGLLREVNDRIVKITWGRVRTCWTSFCDCEDPNCFEHVALSAADDIKVCRSRS